MSTQVVQDRSSTVISPPGISNKANLRQALFAHGPVLPKISAPLLSGLASGNLFVVSDYTSLYRATQDVITSDISLNPTSSLSSLHHVLSSKATAMDYHAFGTASGINTVIGLIQMKQDFDQLAYLGAIGDKRALMMKQLSLVKDGALTGAGVSFAAFRPLAMVSAIKDAAPTSLLGRVTTGAVYLGLIFYAVFFAIFSVIFGIQIHEGSKFRQKLNQTDDLAEQMEMLQKQLNVSPARVFDKMVAKEMEKLTDLPMSYQETSAIAAARRTLISEAFASAKEGMRSLMGELNIEEGSEERLEQIVQSAIESVYAGKTPKQIRELVEVDLMFAGLQLRVQKEQIKKQSKVERILDKMGMDALREISKKPDLVNRVKAGDAKAIEEAQKLVGTIRDSNRSVLTEKGILLGILVVGMVAMILPLILVSGTGALVSAVVMLLFSLVMSGVDGYYLWQSYKGERPAQHDRKLMILSTVVGLASFLTVIALAASGVVTMGTFPLVLLIVLTVLWLGQNAVTWHVMNRNEKKHQLENPTLESFLERLSSKEELEKIMQMFDHLPEEIKSMIEVELQQVGSSEASQGQVKELEEATRRVIQKVEKAKQARLDMLHEALAPHLFAKHTYS